MLLAADVGGTKTLLGLFESAEPRPTPVAVRAYPSTAYRSFTEILAAFARDVPRHSAVDAFVSGVAGPVVGNAARLTNIEWDVSTAEMSASVGTSRVRLLNDLEALANSVEVLADNEYVMLQEGTPRKDGNAAVIAAGTGLGEAYLNRVGGRLVPMPSEGGHADFAARTDREIELLHMLRKDYGRAEVEHVLSGPGLLNIHRFTHRGRTCAALEGVTPEMGPAAISQAALASDCGACVEALDIFVSAYGAVAGNLALRGVATAGLYVGGGMAPKIMAALLSGAFMEAFRAKGTMTELVSRVPVKVIMNTEAGLLGAALYAQEMSRL